MKNIQICVNNSIGLDYFPLSGVIIKLLFISSINNYKNIICSYSVNTFVGITDGGYICWEIIMNDASFYMNGPNFSIFNWRLRSF